MDNVYDARLVQPTPEEWQKLKDENLRLQSIIVAKDDTIEALRKQPPKEGA
jgi:hypothetical protein